MTPQLYTALKWGALLGGPLALFETWSEIVTLNAQNPADPAIAFCLGTLLEAMIPLIAGWLAARSTGDRRSGLIAGLTAAAIVALVNIVAEQVLPVASAAAAGDQATTLADAIASWVLARAITLGFGAWFGWLGGRLGVMTIPPASPPR